MYLIIAGVTVFILVAWTYFRLKRELRRLRLVEAKAHRASAESDHLYHKALFAYLDIDQESGLVTRINDTALSWLGYSCEQVVEQMSHADLMEPETATRYRNEIAPALLRDKKLAVERLDYQRADGSSFPASLILELVSDANGRVMTRCVVQDISAQCQWQSEVSELRAALERKAGHLNRVQKELESFSYSVSHDLRAPLRAISGYAMIIEEDYVDVLDSKGQDLLKVIRKNVTKMDSLISDLLTLSRATTGELSMGRFSMQETVKQSITALEREHDKVQFIVEDLPDAYADQRKIEQVWKVLIDNAVKFSARQEHPLIRISSAAIKHEIVYQISDNGVGFDMRYVHKLFGTFQHLHRQEEFPGSGIGLALIQRIITRHQGRVWAESHQGKGACFYFTLPKNSVAGKETVVQASANASGSMSPAAIDGVITQQSAN